VKASSAIMNDRLLNNPVPPRAQIAPAAQGSVLHRHGADPGAGFRAADLGGEAVVRDSRIGSKHQHIGAMAR
jgi:hypothetical protein